MAMMRSIEKAPPAIVSGGRINYGFFDAPVRGMNLSDARPGGALAFRPLREARLKEWLGFFFDAPGWAFTVFMHDSKFLGSANIYANNLETGESFRRSFGAPGRAVRLSSSMHRGVNRLSAPGFHVEVRGMLDKGRHEIEVDVKGWGGRPAISMELVATEDAAHVQPLTACFPLRGEGRFIYTHKAPMPIGGSVRVGERRIVIDPARDLALMDEHKSVFPHRTVWRWATFAFRDKTGEIVGLNIGDHETADDKSVNNENCVWRGNTLSLIGAARFEMDSKRRMEPWRISDAQGRADVVFEPEFDKLESFDILAAGIHYFQPYGRFNGFVTSDGGERIRVENIRGVAEMMDARF